MGTHAFMADAVRKMALAAVVILAVVGRLGAPGAEGSAPAGQGVTTGGPTAGVVSNFADPSMSNPDAITAGPDGALWFTNDHGNSIGRITTSGVVSNYTDPSIRLPAWIVAGPDGALWFTNSGNDSIGTITP